LQELEGGIRAGNVGQQVAMAIGEPEQAVRKYMMRSGSRGSGPKRVTSGAAAAIPGIGDGLS
jgi:hypothetical protein